MGLTQANRDRTEGTSASPDRPKSDIGPKSQAFLAAFIKAKNDLQLYPPTNPVVAGSLQEAQNLLKDSFTADGRLEFLVEKGGLTINGGQVESNDPRIQKLALSLYRRGVHKIVLDPEISLDELRKLLEAVNLKQEEIAEAGGIEEVIKSREITSAKVEGAESLRIVDGTALSVSDEIIESIEGFEEIESNIDNVTSFESFNRMFVRVEGEDIAVARRLHTLLGNPELFSGLLEKFAVQLEKVEGNLDAAARVERMLQTLHILGTAISSLTSEDDRNHLTKNLAISILTMSTDIRTELVNQGLIPNLVLRSIESDILSRFPITELTDILLENFEASGATASIMEGYFNNLDLDNTRRSALADALRYSLEQGGLLTAEVSAVLELELTEPDGEILPGGGTVTPKQAIPHVEGYPPEKILFRDNERAELTRCFTEGMSMPAADAMAPAILELLRHEKAPKNHAVLLERARVYMEHFLWSNQYEKAACLVKGLEDELEHKSKLFSKVQLRALQGVVEDYLGEDGILRVINAFSDLDRHSEEFHRIVAYLNTLGSPALTVLLRTLEKERSRHVRLLICRALAEVGEKAIFLLGGRLDHPEWYVVRNVVSILGQIATPECLPHLRQALSHTEIRVRKEALKGLAAIGSKDAIDLVCACVNSSDPEMSKAALGWVAAMGAEQALPSIESLLAGKNLWKQKEEIVRAAIETLGSIRTDSSRSLLEKLAQTRRFFHRRRASLIRRLSKKALCAKKGK